MPNSIVNPRDEASMPEVSLLERQRPLGNKSPESPAVSSDLCLVMAQSGPHVAGLLHDVDYEVQGSDKSPLSSLIPAFFAPVVVGCVEQVLTSQGLDPSGVAQVVPQSSSDLGARVASGHESLFVTSGGSVPPPSPSSNGSFDESTNRVSPGLPPMPPPLWHPVHYEKSDYSTRNQNGTTTHDDCPLCTLLQSADAARSITPTNESSQEQKDSYTSEQLKELVFGELNKINLMLVNLTCESRPHEEVLSKHSDEKARLLTRRAHLKSLLLSETPVTRERFGAPESFVAPVTTESAPLPIHQLIANLESHDISCDFDALSFPVSSLCPNALMSSIAFNVALGKMYEDGVSKWHPEIVSRLHRSAKFALSCTCPTCTYLLTVLRFFYPAVVDNDLPQRDVAWSRSNQCRSLVHGDTCPAFACEDFQFSGLRRKDGHCTPGFLNNLERFVSAAHAALSSAQRMNNRDRKAVIQDIRSSYYIIFATRLQDHMMFPFDGHEEFFAQLYEIRRYCSCNGDFGYQQRANSVFTAQGADDTTMFSNLKDFIKSFMPTGVLGSVKETITSLVAKLFGTIFGVFSLITSQFSDMLKYLQHRVVMYLIGCSMASEIMEDGKMKEYMSKFAMFSVLTVVLVASLGGFIGHAVFNLVIRFLGVSPESSTDVFVAQGSTEPYSVVIAICMTVFGLSRLDAESLRKRCLQLTAIMAGGTVLATASSAILSLLPVCVRYTFLRRFGSKAANLRYDFDEWKSKAQTIITSSRISTVVCSDEFEALLDEVMSEGSEIGVKLTEPILRNTFLFFYNKLLHVSTLQNQFRFQQGTRVLPYCVHMAASPGLGKSLIVSSLVRQAFNIRERDIYDRPMNDDYWSGLFTCKAVVIDEFLVGADDSKTLQGKEFLGLVSTQQFMPNCASTDNPSVGVKGTTIAPEVVITCNNDLYNRPPHISATAFQRRRAHVIEISRSQYWVSQKDNPDSVDMSAYTPTEIADVKWANFKVLPGQSITNEARKAFPLWTFRMLIRFLKEDYAQHKDTCTKVAEAFGGGMHDKRTPAEILKEVFAQTYQYPSKPVDLFTSFTGWMTGATEGFTAQGPGAISSTEPGTSSTPDVVAPLREPHYHVCCPRGKVHHNYTLRFTCGYCNKTSRCEDCPIAMQKPGTGSNGDACACTGCYNSGTYRGLCSDHLLFFKENWVDAAHSNLTTTLVPHRHVCTVTNCNRGWYGLHDPDTTIFLCRDHRTTTEDTLRIESKFRSTNEDPLEVVITTAEEENAYFLKNYLPSILHEVRRTVFLSDEHESSPLMNSFINGIVTGIQFSILAFGLRYLFRKLNQQRKDPIADVLTFTGQTFTSQTDPSAKTTSPKKARRARFIRLSKYHSQGDDVPIMQLTISGIRTVWCVPLYDRWLLTFSHALDTPTGELFPEGTELSLNIRGTLHTAFLNHQMVFLERESDICLIQFDNKRMGQFKDIRSRFLEEKDWDALVHVPVKLVNTEGVRYAIGFSVNHLAYAHGSRRFELSQAMKYQMETHKGDCGSLIVVSQGPLANKILGLHVAGTISTANPVGACNIITKESLEDFDDHEVPPLLGADETFESQVGLDVFTKLQGMPNVRKVELVPRREQVFLSQKSKLTYSILHNRLPVTPTKHFPILSRHDPRANGQDPVENFLLRAAAVEQPDLDMDVVHDVYRTIYSNLKRTLDFPLGLRMLSFEEACAGVPGKLASLRVLTSAGYPLAYGTTRQGKQDFIWFGENGEFHYDPHFRQLVEAKVQEMHDYDNGPIDHVFLGFLKDEMVSEAKIREVRTRMVFANDLICLVAFRMFFGCIFAAFKSSYKNTSLAIGMNQYSHDMEALYLWLARISNRFVDGDFEALDVKMVKAFRDSAYGVITSFARLYGVRMGPVKFFFLHETASAIQILNIRIWLLTGNISGNSITTEINCLVTEGYFRYAFVFLEPVRVFDEEIGAKYWGDDHLLTVSELVNFNPIVIRDFMIKLNQNYTAARKTEALTEDYKSFADTTFLGAVPRLVNGRWSGALSKDTLWQAVQVTRDRGLSFWQTLHQMVECASQWDVQFFEHYTESIRTALHEGGFGSVQIGHDHAALSRSVAARQAGCSTDFPGWIAHGQGYLEPIFPPFPPGYFGLGSDSLLYEAQGPPRTGSRSVAARQAGCSTDFPGWIAHGLGYLEPMFPPFPPGYYGFGFDALLYEAQGPPHTGTTVGTTFGLTSIPDAGLQTTVDMPSSSMGGVASHALNESIYSLRTGLESSVLRAQFEWPTSANAAEELLGFGIPFQVLAMGNANNLQNMAFQRMIYFSTDVELLFQINGNPFTQGLAVAYFLPLTNATDVADITCITLNNHVKISPNDNTLARLRIPFVFYRSAMNTFAGGLGTESMGKVGITVLSPLINPTSTPITITMYSSFPNAKFTMPRPIMKPKDSKTDLVSLGSHFYRTRAHLEEELDGRASPLASSLPSAIVEHGPMEAQGASVSKTVNNTTISNSGSVGHDFDIPVENATKQSASTDLKAQASLPMDNPPAFSWTIPVHPSFSGLSKSNGIEPTISMQLHPQMMFREVESLFDMSETTVESIMNRQGLLTTLSWNTQQAEGTVLAAFALNSLVSFDPTYGAGVQGLHIPAHIAFLNLFELYRMDFIFDFYAVKTAFQSGRLTATVGYGAPFVDTDDRNVYLNTILDFSADNAVASVRVNYNAATEFLKMFSGPLDPDPVQNHSLGTLLLTVANRLQANTTVVSTTIDLLVFVRFENVRVVESAFYPRTNLYNTNPYYVNITNQPTSAPVSSAIKSAFPMEAQGPETPSLISVEEKTLPASEVVTVDFTHTESSIVEQPICRLDLGRKFEYCITDIHELCRRHIPIGPPVAFPLNPTMAENTATVYVWDIQPRTAFAGIFAGWAGHPKFRIFSETKRPAFVEFFPTDNNSQDIGGIGALASNLPDLNSYAHYVLQAVGNTRRPREVLFPLGPLSYIDISIPFLTHFNFLAAAPVVGGSWGSSLGILTVVILDSNTAPPPFAFQAFGDDMRMGIPRFRSGLFQPAVFPTGFSSPINLVGFNGLV